MNRKCVAAVLLLITLLLQCSQRKEKPIAKVGFFTKITQAEVDSAYADLKGRERSEFSGPNGKAKFTEYYIAKIAIYKYARKVKYHKQPHFMKIFLDEKQRLISFSFYQEVVLRNAGFSDLELKKYYRRNRNQFRRHPKPTPDNIPNFKNLSEKDQKARLRIHQPFSLVKEAIIDSLILKETDLKGYYNRHKEKYVVDPHAKIAHIMTSTRQKGDSVLSVLKKNSSFGDAAKTFSEDTTSNKKLGAIGTVWYKRDFPGGIGIMWDTQKRIFGKDGRSICDTGIIHEVFKSPKGYHVFKVIQAFPFKGKSFSEARFDINKDVIRNWKSGATDRYFDKLHKKNKIRITDTTQFPSQARVEALYKERYIENAADPSSPPPTLEEVKETIINELMESTEETFDPDFVFARGKRKFKVTKGDLNEVLARIKPSLRQRYKTKGGRAYLVSALVKQHCLYEEARSIGFMRIPRIKNTMDGWKTNFTHENYKKDFIDCALGFSNSELLNYYKKNKIVFLTKNGKGRSFEDSKCDCARKLLMGDKDLENYYNLHAEEYNETDDPILPLDSVIEKVKVGFLEKEIEKKKTKTINLIKKIMAVRIEGQKSLPKADKDLFELGQEILGKSENTDSVFMIFETIREKHPLSEYDDDICLALGQLYISKTAYTKALKEYRRLLRLYPESSHNYKAQFMIGFVYSEHIKDLKKAKAAYEKVVEKYPGTDLVDDAQFMLKYLGKDIFDIDFLKKEKP